MKKDELVEYMPIGTVVFLKPHQSVLMTVEGYVEKRPKPGEDFDVNVVWLDDLKHLQRDRFDPRVLRKR